MNFNPLPPHGGRRRSVACLRPECHFNPLPPHGGRPVSDLGGVKTHAISIHSLRMEGDRPAGCWTIHRTSFQSTPSAWRETIYLSADLLRRLFQSTPSAWRETGLLLGDGGGNSHFNPLPPHGGRPDSVHDGRKPKTISIHSLRMEGDHSSSRSSCGASISIHSLRMEGDI